MSTDYVINNDKLNCVKFNINVKQHTEMSSVQNFYFKPEKKSQPIEVSKLIAVRTVKTADLVRNSRFQITGATKLKLLTVDFRKPLFL
jgi:hypothetical protein